jgi:hypothetical protein
MVQVVIHPPELWHRGQGLIQASTCGICMDNVALGQVFLLSTVVFCCQYHSTNALYTLLCNQWCIILVVDIIRWHI